MIDAMRCGPRQTGKTTLLNHIATHHKNVLNYSFLEIPLRQRAEQQPEFLRQEVEAASPDIIIIDEVQKVPDWIKNHFDTMQHRYPNWVFWDI